MKKYILLLFLLFSLILAGCGPKTTGKTDFKIITTIYPLHLIVNQIDSTVTSDALIKGSISPHHYSAKPSDIVKINRADILFKIGGPFDSWIDDIVSKNKIDIKTVNFLGKMKISEDSNPHIWLSFKNSKKLATITDELLNEEYPNNKSNHKKNLNKFISDLSKLESEWREKFSELENNKVILYHPAWKMILEELNVGITTVIKNNPQKNITLKEMRNIIDKIKESNTKLIIGEIQHKDPIIKRIEKQTDIKVIYLNAIGSSEFQTYDQFLKYNLNKIYYGLK
ncbi:MAG: zinc ABC transporter substrate-binding protein [Candidatus Mcinerneyibacterium aminivorans]|uniref:Zinc ABC transporter substrate-binding protein n=1 Tax=Candidatus Mcinerneyibacterium aminivorans TaxID=2703815 RepID=A0A5D0MA10_9BACT|nr:MAG: zinc ABC transporter substrate-binding protein [Candidatus Mcinerneyibacterium aminivorans]